ncbi:MAG: DUF4981 domain-containing protein [Colwellia sp.]
MFNGCFSCLIDSLKLKKKSKDLILPVLTLSTLTLPAVLINKVRHTLAFFLLLILCACSNQSELNSVTGKKSTETFTETFTETLMLSGTGSDDAIQWDFYCDKGNNCGEWSTIAVPSNWELQGFGNYDYGHVREKHNEQGIYRRDFDVPENWQQRTVKIVFDGVMTDSTVFVNQQQVGPTHQGGFYRFSYDITPFLKFGQQNEVKVVVNKISADKSIELAERQADYWVFGGIFRQVFLQTLPKAHIDWVNLDAKANGQFIADVHLQGLEQALEQTEEQNMVQIQATEVQAQILDMTGKPMSDFFTANIVGDKAELITQVKNPRLWTAETPNLYQVRLQLKAGDKTLHTLDKTIGFRTFELRAHDGLYLNGEKIILKGVNRHSFRPETGRTTSKQISIDDIKLIKSMNMNAVRMSHYPPDVHFLQAADRMGIYVINELTTWQKPVLDTKPARRLVEQLVKRDQTHPSILMWANGNEGGWNTEVDDDYALYDIQNRPVLHPWELFRNIDTDHYPTYAELLAKKPQNEVFFPTEFLHGLYDGGHGAGLRDFWDFMMSTPLGAGGFLWVLADEGVVRTDQGGRIDTDGNHAPDGIVGPHGEPEASFFTIKEIWSPIQIENLPNGELLPQQFDGQLQVKNLYNFIDLSSTSLEWSLYQPVTAFSPDKQLVASGKQMLPAIKPDASGTVNLNLPKQWQQQGWLEVELFNAEKNSIWTDAWPIQSTSKLDQLTAQAFMKQAFVKQVNTGQPKIVVHNDKELQISVADRTIIFDTTTGLLKSYAKQGNKSALTNGPRLLRSDNALYEGQYNSIGTWLANGANTTETAQALAQLKIEQKKDKLIIGVENPPAGISKLIWTVHATGYLSLDLDYSVDGKYILHGIAFNYPKEAIEHKRWLGDGPYRVWANRLEGVNFSVWENDYNEGVAGENWQFPEFKGYFSDIQWLTLGAKNSEIHFSTATPNLFARIMQPEDGARPDNTVALTYNGEISFLHRISAIGTKFHAAHNMGPQGQEVAEKGTRNIKLNIF